MFPTGRIVTMWVKWGFVLPLLLLAIAVPAPRAMAQSPGTFTLTGNLSTARGWGTSATLLLNSKVLMVGGVDSSNTPLASAELYDPSTGAFAPTSSMTTARILHKATLLADGRVLITGGRNGTQNLASAELYDPSTGAFTVTGAMTTMDAFGAAATLLPDGKVLVTGCAIPCNSAVAQLYDPATEQFTTASMPGAGGGTATLLADGMVLITGGCPADFHGTKAQLFDPGTGMFSFTGPMTGDCYNINTATLLTNGKVLFAGNEENDGFPAYAELYDPAAGTFTSLGATLRPHEFSAATLLSDGTVLIAGGQLPGGKGDPGAELYDPITGKFSATGNVITTRFGQTATLLPDGRVLIAGGETGQHPYTSNSDPFQPTVTASAELYTPAVLQASSALFSVSGNGRGQGAIWQADTGQIASSESPAIAGEVLSMYTTGLVDGGVIPPQVTIGGRMAEVLFFGKAPGYPGFNQVNFRVPSGVARGAAVPVWLRYLGRVSNAVTIGVR